LLAYYGKRIAAANLQRSAQAGSLPFQWQTDFDFCWMDGWCKNREHAAERNILVRIPGKDRSRAVIMADHYDTAYEADRYETDDKRVRVAAWGADDNYSATAALMLAAPIFFDMSARGELGCDIWLIHLTGEEFPADCLGARHLCQALVEGTLKLHLPSGKAVDLSKTQVKALYVSDMIAHNNDHDRDIFQIAPGASRASLWCAEQAQIATCIWNASVPVWNQKAERQHRGRSRRSPHGAAIPEVARHLALNGQVRTVVDLRSTLFNTDGQIFSDVGVPAVLFMENYDINRLGYHDTHDTMENIDLDYGAALAAIVIETVARAATIEMPVMSAP
jgi:Zn-dependent M28 family amino/carboxypeptidase